jgi:2-desacetyl-2-hydroxyethyl bacteriochlorophyllide A dehydrogenase
MTLHRSALQRQCAVVIHDTGDLRIESRPVPAPARGEALVAIGAVGICGSDLSYFTGSTKYPIKGPFVLGHEAAGVVVDVGPATAPPDLRVGDTVALVPSASCGHCERCHAGYDNLCPEVRYLGSAAVVPHVDGALQTYLTLPVGRLVAVPDTVTVTAAALLEPLGVAEHAVRRAQVADQKVLVVGGGAIGQLVALVARCYGAESVAVSDIRPRRRRLAVAHGADRAIPPEEVLEQAAAGEDYTVVVEATGNPLAVDLALRALRPGRGRLVIVGNLPTDSGISAESVTRAETWVSGVFRFPGGLTRALALVTSGLSVEWLVEHTAGIDHATDAFSRAVADDPPLKTHIRPPAAAGV